MYNANSYSSDSAYRTGDFILSSVNSADLKRYGINRTVKDFKNVVRKSRCSKVIVTGGNGYERHTFVYNYNDFRWLK